MRGFDESNPVVREQIRVQAQAISEAEANGLDIQHPAVQQNVLVRAQALFHEAQQAEAKLGGVSLRTQG